MIEKRTHQINSIQSVRNSDILNAISKIKRNKAPDWSLLNDTILKEMEDKPKLLTIFTTIINEMFQRKHIPQCLSTARLIILNKIPSEIPKLKSTRPIATMGPIIKIIE